MVAPASSVRSTGQPANEFHPVHRSTGEENNFEGDYFYELKSSEIITSHMPDDVCTNDYDLDMSAHVDALAIASPAAERLFGGMASWQLSKFRLMTASSVQRRSMTDRTDTLSEIDSRPSEAIPVQKVASPIASTRPVLPQFFGLSG